MPTILIVNGNASEIAGRLLAAAGDQPDRVQYVTGGATPGFQVDDELARKAGYVTDDEGSTPVVNDGAPENPESDSKKSEKPAEKPAPAKRTTSRTGTK